ncbi:putative acylesterase/phospholipase RssA [Paraburkholderia strydomiana]|nr:putative acylesterase/phospholipase RssA [Paraburkholderia strydomiana]
MRNQLKEISRPHDELALPRYDEIALVLQGGGALGSYQAGVVESLVEARIEPNWIAGVSIGALNTAIIAGNAPEHRVQALHGLWNAICRPPNWLTHAGAWTLPYAGLNALARKWASNCATGRAVAEGRPGFFVPRVPPPLAGFDRLDPARVSYYATTALKAILLEYANFDRINDGPIRVSVGAVNVRTGNLVSFDNMEIHLAPEHFMALGALPPGFPANEIEGEYYWDGGLVSNTPLTEIVAEAEHKASLIFQVDLWSSRGKTPPISSTLRSAPRTFGTRAARAQSRICSPAGSSMHGFSTRCSGTCRKASRRSIRFFAWPKRPRTAARSMSRI